MEEIWKPVSACNIKLKDGRMKYEVSNLGRVRAYVNKGVDRWKEECRILKQYVDGRGFCSVGLYGEKGKPRRFYVHTLVATEFVENPDNLNKVEHLDGNNGNNRADNLRWCVFGARRGKAKEPVEKSEVPDKAKYRKVFIRQYTMDGKFVAEYPSTSAAAKAVYLSSGSQIGQCCRREPGRMTSAGFMWRYADDDELAEKAGVSDG